MVRPSSPPGARGHFAEVGDKVQIAEYVEKRGQICGRAYGHSPPGRHHSQRPHQTRPDAGNRLDLALIFADGSIIRSVVEHRPGMNNSKNNDFESLLEYLRSTRGFDFSAYKRTTLGRRVD